MRHIGESVKCAETTKPNSREHRGNFPALPKIGHHKHAGKRGSSDSRVRPETERAREMSRGKTANDTAVRNKRTVTPMPPITDQPAPRRRRRWDGIKGLLALIAAYSEHHHQQRSIGHLDQINARTRDFYWDTYDLDLTGPDLYPFLVGYGIAATAAGKTHYAGAGRVAYTTQTTLLLAYGHLPAEALAILEQDAGE